MARKREKAVVKIGDVNDYIKSPNPYVRLKGEFNIMKMRVFTRLALDLNAMVNARLEECREQGVKPTYLIPEDLFVKGMAVIDMPLSTFGVMAKHYDDLRGACIELSNLKVYFKEETDDKDEWSVTNVFERMEVIRDKKTNELQVRAIISHLAAEQVFTLTHGYTEYNRNIALECSKPHAVKLYQLLSCNRDTGSLTIKYKELKEFLGVLKYDDKKHTTIVKDKYPYFSHFIRHVLEPSREALRKLVDADKLDFYFDYEPINETPRKKSADPDAIHFTLVPHLVDAEELKKETKPRKGRATETAAEREVKEKFRALLRDMHVRSVAGVKPLTMNYNGNPIFLCADEKSWKAFYNAPRTAQFWDKHFGQKGGIPRFE